MKTLTKITLITLLVFASILSHAQYCTTNLNTAGSYLQDITLVSLTGTTLNNSSHPSAYANGSNYYLFSATGNTTGVVSTGSTYTLGVSTNEDVIISAWIDYNQNSTFESTEWTQVAISSGAVMKSISITIPTNASIGQTRMRIRTRLATFQNGASDACIDMASGVVEDYIVTIQSSTATIPDADFTNSSAFVPGQSGTFSDLSKGIPTSWSWGFTGGTPSTSTLQNPSVTYATAGSYPVKLIATNALGSDTVTKLVYVQTSVFTETFTTAWTTCNAPNSWTSEDACGSTDAWHKYGVTTGWTLPTGGSTVTTGSDDVAYARFHSYSITASNTSDLITSAINMSTYSTASLSFYYINPTGTDNISIYFSKDGGTTWSSVAGITSTSSSWTKQTVTIDNTYLTSNFKVKFRATSDYGTDDMGLDQIVIVAGLITPTKFNITSINSGTDPGVNSPFSIVVKAQDLNNSSGNVIANTSFNLTLATGTGILSGTLSGTISAGSNSTTVAGILYNKKETGVSIKATQTTGDLLNTATSSTFSVKDTNLVFVNIPTTSFKGLKMQTFTVEVRKGDGTLASGYSGNVTLTKTAGVGTLAGTLTKAVVAGIATFNDNVLSELGSYTINATASNFSPIPTATINVIQLPAQTNFGISGGSGHALMLNSDGTVSSWGFNINGQLGRGTMGTNALTPDIISGLSSIKMIHAGSGNHSLALDCNGNVWAWGCNKYGELGRGTFGDSSITPQKVLKGLTSSSTAYLENVISISAGNNASYALLSDGNVVAWGKNNYGQLANNSITNASTPVYVQKNTGKLGNIISISAGDGQCYGLTSDGVVYAWGGDINDNNQTGIFGNKILALSLKKQDGTELKNVVKITAGDTHGLFLDSDGYLWAIGGDWGAGQLGISSFYDTKAYVQKVSSGALKNITGKDYLTGVISIAAGQQHSTAVVDPDGDGLGYLMTWGSNDVPSGLGYGYGKGFLCNGLSYTDQELPVFAMKSATAGDTLKNVIAVSKGDAVTYIETYNTTSKTNEVWAVGGNNMGMLGNATTADAGYPVAISTALKPTEPCPIANLGADTITACLGNNVTLNAGNTASTYNHYIWYKNNVMLGSNDVSDPNNQNWTFDATYDKAIQLFNQPGTYKVEIYNKQPISGCSNSACGMTSDQVVIIMPNLMIDTLMYVGCAGDSIQFAFVSKRTEGGRYYIYSTQTGGTPLKTFSLASADTVRFNINYDAAVKVNDSTFTLYVEDASYQSAIVASKTVAPVLGCAMSDHNNPTSTYTGLKVFDNVRLATANIKMKGWSTGNQTLTPVIYASTTDISSGTRPNTSSIVWTGTPQNFSYTTTVQEYTVNINCNLTGTDEGTIYWLGFTGSGSGVMQKFTCAVTLPLKDNLNTNTVWLNRWVEFNCDGCTSTGIGTIYNMQFEQWKYPCNRILLTAKSKCNTCVPPAPVSISPSTGDSTLCPSTSVTLNTNSQANTNYEYVWFKNSVSDATRVKLPVNAVSDNITVSQSSPGTYYVLVRSKNNQRDATCQSMDQQVIVAKSAPTISGVTSTTICLGKSATLKATGAASYIWNTTSGIDSIVVSPAVKTTYTVTATGSNGCTASKSATVTVNNCMYDYDNNSYSYSKIGSLNWMISNLKTTHYADGTALLDGAGAGNTTADQTSKYYFTYNDSATYLTTYGRLYTWPAAMNGAASSTATPSGVQGVCPTGWHLPSKAEYDSLIYNLGGDTIAGGKLKSTGTTYWYTPNTSATNLSGFGALPGGYRNSDSISYERRTYANYWVTDQFSAQRAKVLRLSYNSKSSAFNDFQNNAGLSVRCVQDYCSSLTVNAGADQSICAGQSATLAALGSGSYNWSNGATLSDITVSPTTTTTYTVTIVTTSGCTASDNLVVTVNPKPTAIISGAEPICFGKSDTLTASGGNAYTWSGGGSLTTKIIAPSSTTIYTVTAIDTNGCTDTESATVVVKMDCALPYAILNGDSIFVYPVDNVESIAWAPNGAVTNAQSMTNGVENTALIIQQHGPGNYPAYLCDTLKAFGFSDWYLPARDELDAIHTYKANVPDMDYWYWTSTESNLTSDAYIQNFTFNTSGNISKSSNMSARCIRRALTVTTNSNGGWVCAGNSRNISSSANGGVSPYTYLWSNGVTTSSQEVFPTVTTTYVVTVTDGANNTATGSRIITVYSLPTITIAGDISLCAGESTSLTASGGNIYSWNTGGNTAVLSVTPSATTTYTVTVTDANSCSNTETSIVTINTSPVVSIGGSNSGNPICVGTTVNLNTAAAGGQSPYTYLWSTGSTSTIPSVSPVTNVTYIVTATDANGCSDTETYSIVVNNNPTPTISGTSVICNGTTTTLTASGGSFYAWSNGGSLYLNTITPATTSTYTLTATLNGCSSTTDIQVTVNPLPTASAGGNITICAGTSTTLSASGGTSFSWNTGATTSSIAISPTVQTAYTVTVTDLNGCKDNAEAIVSIGANLLPNAGSDITICAGDSIQLTANGGSSYIWSNSGESTSTISVNPISNTTYTVTADDGQGCTGTDEVVVVVKALPTASFGTFSNICLNESTTLTALGGTSYNWNTNETTASITVSPSNSSKYTVTVSTNGCTDSEDLLLMVTLPVANAGVDQSIINGQSASLTATGGSSYSWSHGPTTDIVSVSPTTKSTYTVVITENGCTDSDDVIVDVTTNTITADAGTDVTICAGNSTTLTAKGGTIYTWNTNATTAQITVNPTTTTTYTVTVGDGISTATDEVVIIVSTPTVNAGPDQTICKDDAVALFANSSSAIAFNWAGDAQSILNLTKVASISASLIVKTITVDELHTYTITVTDANGCTATDEVVVTYQAQCKPYVSILANPTSSICKGESTTLKATVTSQKPLVTVVWSDGVTNTNATVTGTGSDYTISDLPVTPLTTTTYTLNATDNTSSEGLGSIVITVHSLPTASVTNVTVCDGNSASITASGGYSYTWNNATSNSILTMNPAVAGIYTVTVIDVNGCTDDATGTIDVNANPTANAGSDLAICVGTSTPLSVQNSGGTYAWNTLETSATISISPTTNTTYTVTVTNNGCSATDDIQVTVNQLPIIDAGNNVAICKDMSIPLAVTPNDIGYSYAWAASIGGNIDNYSSRTPNASLNNPSSLTSDYSVTYTVTVTNTITACTSIDQVTVTFEVICKPQVTLVAGKNTICFGESTTIEAIAPWTGPLNYTWSNGLTGAGPNTIAPLVTTTYYVTVADQNDPSKSDNAELVLTVNPLPVITASASPTTICIGASSTLSASSGVQFAWSSSATTQTCSVTPVSDITYTVSVLDANGCPDTGVVVVHVNQLPVVAIIADANMVCPGNITNLTASGGTSYLWSSSAVTTNVITVTPAIQTTYSVTATDANGCKNNASAVVGLFPMANVNAGNDIAICMGTSTPLSVQGNGQAFKWNTNETTSTINVIPIVNTTYYITITTVDGCTDADNVVVTVNPLPTATITGNTSFCFGASTTLNAQGGITYLWNTGSKDEVCLVSTGGTYTVTITDANGCTATDDIVVTIQTPDADAGYDISITEGHNANLSATGGATYIWSTGSTSANITVSPSIETIYSVTVTDSKGCSNSDNVIVSVSSCAKPSISSEDAIQTVCENEAVVISIPYTGDNVKFQWTNSNQSIVSISNSVPISSATLLDADVYTCTLSNVCGSVTGSVTLIVNELPLADITVAGNTTFCKGDSAILITNTGENYSYQWLKNGVTITGSTTAYFTAKDAGAYAVKITNNITGCSKTSAATIINVNSTDFNVAYVVDKDSLTATPFIVQFTNATPSATDYNFKWTFGDFKDTIAKNSTHQYKFNGTYDISLTATNKTTGCVNMRYDSAYILCNAIGKDDPCDTKIKITRTGSNKICVGDSVLLSAITPIGSICQWTLNDEILPEGINDTLFAKAGGEYGLTVDWASCSVSANAMKISSYPKVTPAITSTDILDACLKNDVTLKVNTFFKSYSWSTGETTFDIRVNKTGSYTVTTVDVFGCDFASAPYVLSTTTKAAPAICIVTVDYDTKKNMILWEKKNDPSIKSYNIYSETSQSNVYQKLGNVATNKLSMFTDITSSPSLRAYKYKIASVDTCGLESELSEHHRTLHLNVAKNSQGAGFNLSWVDSYEGFDYSTYYILRSLNNGDFVKVDSIASTLTSYTDTTSLKGKLFYTIAAIKPGYICNPMGDSKGVLPIEFKGASYSNVSDEMTAIDGIETAENSTISIYPNPVRNSLTIETNLNHKQQFDIIDLLGKVVYSNYVQMKTTIDMTNMADGVYFVKLNTGKSVVVQKFVKR